MLRTTVLSVGLCLVLLGVSVAQEPRERVRQSLSYPPLMAQVNLGFDLPVMNIRGGQTPAERVAQLERSVRENPNDADAWLELVEAYYTIHRDEQAVQTRIRESLERAAALYRARLEASPDDARTMARLALALQGLNQTDEALQLAQRAVQLAPELADGWKAHARALLADSSVSLAQGMPQRFRKSWDELEPEKRAAWQARIQQARAAYERWYALAPNDPSAASELFTTEFLELLIAALSQHADEVARRAQQIQQRALNALRAQPPLYEVALTGLIVSLVWTDAETTELPEAIHKQLRKEFETIRNETLRMVERELAAASGAQRAQLRVAQYVLKWMGNPNQEPKPDEFFALVEELYTHNPNDVELRRSMFYLTLIRERWAEAERMCRDTLQRQPDPETYHWLIVALDRQGKLDEANKAIGEFYRALPEDPYAMLFRSLQLMRMQGDAESLTHAGELIRAASRGLAVQPDDRRWGYLEAVRAAHVAMAGDTAQARALIRQVRQRYPDIQFAERVAQAVGE